MSPKRRGLLEIEEALLGDGGAGRVIALSRRVLRDIERWFPEAARLAVVIPPGVDLERFRPAGREHPGPPPAPFLARPPPPQRPPPPPPPPPPDQAGGQLMFRQRLLR